MKIALTMRIQIDAAHGEVRDSISHDWIRFLAQAGQEFILIPNLLPQVDLFLQKQKIEMIILSGGEDLVLDSRESPLRQRDFQERAVLKYAILNRIPVLGVCRGLQLLNDFFGGRTRVDEKFDFHRGKEHPISFKDPFLESIFEEKHLTVNSYHKNVIEVSDLGTGLKCIANSDDGSVEAALHDDYPILGLMWHPERRFQDEKIQKIHNDRFFEKIQNQLNNRFL